MLNLVSTIGPSSIRVAISEPRVTARYTADWERFSRRAAAFTVSNFDVSSRAASWRYLSASDWYSKWRLVNWLANSKATSAGDALSRSETRMLSVEACVYIGS